MSSASGRQALEHQLLELITERGPKRIRARLHDPLTGIGEAVLMRVVEGRLLDARIGRHEDADALLILALADGAELEVGPEQAASSRVGPSFRSLWAEAKTHAAEVERALEPLGGLRAVPRATGEKIAGLPEAALEVAELVDGRRTLAMLLGAARLTPTLTARILARLFEVEAIVVPPMAVEVPQSPSSAPGWVPPDSGWGESSVLPSDDLDEEIEGDAAAAQVKDWLDQGAERPLVTGEAFRSVFVEERAVPVAAPLVRSPSMTQPIDFDGSSADDDDDDEAAAKDAVANRAPLAVIVLASAGALLALLIGFLGQDQPVVERPPLPPPTKVVTSTVVKTSTVAPEMIEGRPAIAPADAPAEVKRAEKLIMRGEYDEAEELLAKLRQSMPTDPVVLTLSGQLYADMSRLDRAAEMAEQALVADPKFYRGWVLKGSVAQFLGQKGAAVSAYEKAVSLEPQHPMTPEIRSVLDGLKSR